MSDLQAWLDGVTAWARSRSDVLGVALVGSHATGKARDGSDVDVVVVFEDSAAALAQTDWVSAHGAHGAIEREDHGLVQSLRVHYAGGHEVEWGVTDRRWTTTDPLDAPTARVVRGGLRILHDPRGLVAALVRAATAS